MSCQEFTLRESCLYVLARAMGHYMVLLQAKLYKFVYDITDGMERK